MVIVCSIRRNFNPRSPDGERRTVDETAAESTAISIHAPRMGSDGYFIALSQAGQVFQSTLPGWGATFAFCHGPSL